MTWEFWDIDTGNLVGYTKNPVTAFRWWLAMRRDKDIAVLRR